MLHAERAECIMTSATVILLTGRQPGMRQAQCCSNLVDWQATWTRQGAIAQFGTRHTLPAGKSTPQRAPWEPFTAEVWKEVGGGRGTSKQLTLASSFSSSRTTTSAKLHSSRPLSASKWRCFLSMIHLQVNICCSSTLAARQQLLQVNICCRSTVFQVSHHCCRSAQCLLLCVT